MNSDEQVQALLRVTEKYCVVYQTLRAAPPISWSREIAPVTEG
jgi:uncharacterized OsmC-like protein